jgi:hypothetical protein
MTGAPMTGAPMTRRRRVIFAVAVLFTGLIASGCGVRATEPVALGDTVPPTAAPATTVYRIGSEDVQVRLETVSSRVYFVSNGLLEYRIRAVVMPQQPSNASTAQRNFFKTQRKQAIIDALLSGPTESEREDGLATSLSSLVNLRAPSPVVVSQLELGTQSQFVSLDLVDQAGSADDVLLAYAQLVWTLDPDGEDGIVFTSIVNGQPVNLTPPRDERAGASTGSVVFGEDYSCFVSANCVDRTSVDTVA